MDNTEPSMDLPSFVEIEFLEESSPKERIAWLEQANAFHKKAAHEAVQEQWRLIKKVEELEKHTQSEIIAGYIHKIDGLRGQIREMGTFLKAKEQKGNEEYLNLEKKYKKILLEQNEMLRKELKGNDSDAVEFLAWCFKTYGHTLNNIPEWFYKLFKKSKL